MPSIHFITQGCSANQADSEIMWGILKEKGFSFSDNEDNADIVVINSCTVKGPTLSFFRKKMKELEGKDKKIIVAGCIPQSNRNFEHLNGHSLVGTFQVDRIGEAVKQTLEGNKIVLLEKENKPRLNLPKTRLNPLIEIVPILQGCLSSCTFCKTKHARGNAFSHSPEAIVRHISWAAREGAKEIWLTSQDNSVYGLDFGIVGKEKMNLAKLLEQICAIPRDFMIRVGMANPKYILPMLDELITSFKHKKVYKFLHVPLQSGSNKVLEDMKRGYTTEDYALIIKRFKEEIPEITISTDIICGFPTETREDFEKTVALIKATRPDVINISKFWPMQGTPAARMKQIEGSERKRRTAEMVKLHTKMALENNKNWIGWKGKVLMTEKGKHGTLKGRNFAYKQIIADGEESLLGKQAGCRIVGCGRFDLRGDLSAAFLN
ncbi:tRNA (N(6)-L-threonylcarbamoyladenosine(37)-C(2))-methylthiotransferase [Candidatus Woesearchaeota archaeon]|nr:tRNA (N(6)-L-threonylcarbamoyladenosine(37)-C(2))-methylthiotransferase [Candidatus Woesearchaeota archaeon]